MINLNHPGLILMNYMKLLLKSLFNSMNHCLLFKHYLNQKLQHPIQVHNNNDKQNIYYKIEFQLIFIY